MKRLAIILAALVALALTCWFTRPAPTPSVPVAPSFTHPGIQMPKVVPRAAPAPRLVPLPPRRPHVVQPTNRPLTNRPVVNQPIHNRHPKATPIPREITWWKPGRESTEHPIVLPPELMPSRP